jgi:hypothetical protein
MSDQLLDSSARRFLISSASNMTLGEAPDHPKPLY